MTSMSLDCPRQCQIVHVRICKPCSIRGILEFSHRTKWGDKANMEMVHLYAVLVAKLFFNSVFGLCPRICRMATHTRLRLRKLRIDATASGSDFDNGEEDQNDEEPVTPAGRMFYQPGFYCTVMCILGFKHPIDLVAFKQELMNTIVKHKRFSSLLRKNKTGRECWVKTDLNIDNHVILPELPASQIQAEKFVEEYTATLADAKPLDTSRPLWEVHVLNHKAQDAGVCIFRFHHALGDGTSLMSLFLASTRQLKNPQLLPTVPNSSEGLRKQPSDGKSSIIVSFVRTVWTYILVLWYSILEIWKFSQMHLWQRDSDTLVKGPYGCENWPKSLSIATLSLDDMRIVKKAVSATINDVLMAVISLAIKRYLENTVNGEAKTRDGIGKQQRTLENLRVRALVLMNTRPSPGLKDLADMMKGGSKARWGNNMGYILIPLTLNNFSDPLDHVRRAKACSARKKHSLEAYFTYSCGAYLMDIFGPKGAVELTYRSAYHTTLTVSNVMGPLEDVTFAGNPITYIVPTSSALPQGIVLHMASYKGTVKVALMVKKDIIPDSDFLAKCFEDALQDLKQAVSNTTC